MSTIVITGISRGIGLGIARHYLAMGDNVIGSIRTPCESVDALQSEFSESLELIRMDVRESSAVDAAAKQVTATHSAVDIVICNAGVSHADSPFQVDALPDLRDAPMIDTFDVNVVGPLRVARAFHPLLAKGAYPKLVIITSGFGSLAQTEDGSVIPYCVSKAAVNMLSRRLHFLLEDDGIAVLALSPGWVRTDMGGPDARISTDESAEGIADVIAGYDRNSPPFQNYQGIVIPW